MEKTVIDRALEVLEAQPIEVWLLGGFGVMVLAVVLVGSRTTGGSRRMKLYRAVVVYEYEVGGKRFKGDRITQSPGLNRGTPEFADKVARRYAAGAPVDVRFNPSRPGDCVLEARSPSWLAGLVIALGMLGLAIGRARF